MAARCESIERAMYLAHLWRKRIVGRGGGSVVFRGAAVVVPNLLLDDSVVIPRHFETLDPQAFRWAEPSINFLRA